MFTLPEMTHQSRVKTDGSEMLLCGHSNSLLQIIFQDINKVNLFHYFITIMVGRPRKIARLSLPTENTGVPILPNELTDISPSPNQIFSSQFDDSNQLSSPEITSPTFESYPPDLFSEHLNFATSPPPTNEQLSHNVTSVLTAAISEQNSNIFNFEISRKMANFEEKLDQMSNMLQDIFYYLFHDDFLKKNLIFIKKFFEINIVSPNPGVILSQLEFEEAIPSRLRDPIFRSRNLSLISKCVNNIRANMVRMVKDGITGKNSMVEIIKKIKEYLLKNSSQEVTMNEKFFMLLLIDNIQCNQNNSLFNAENKFTTYSTLSLDDKKTQFIDLASKVKRIDDFII